MRRLQRRDLPLIDGHVGDAEQAHLAVRPGLTGGPFNRIVEVPRLARRPQIEIARRITRAAHVERDDGVAVSHPSLRIGVLPAHEATGRLHGDVRVCLQQLSPARRIGALKRCILAVRPLRHHDRIGSGLPGTKNIGVDNVTVAQGHGDILVVNHRRSAFQRDLFVRVRNAIVRWRSGLRGESQAQSRDQCEKASSGRVHELHLLSPNGPR